MASGVAARNEPGALGDKVLLKLVGRFLGCFAALFAIIVWLGARTRLVMELMAATAGAATALMNLTGVVATHAGAMITVPGRRLMIGADCTGVMIVALLVSLVLAYPVRISSKVIGVLVGILAVYGANLARLVLIAHISRAPDMLFNVAHDFLFQVGMVAVAIAVWAVWLSFARARES